MRVNETGCRPFTLFAFVATVELSDYGKRKASQALANTTPECSERNVDRVIQKYSPDHIAKQIVYKINNDAKKSGGFDIPVYLDGSDFVLGVQVFPDAKVDWQWFATVPSSLRSSYCSDYQFWEVARRLNYNLMIVLFDADRTLLHRQRVTAKDCQ